MAQVVQQWLYFDGKAKDLVVRSIRLDVSAVPSLVSESQGSPRELPVFGLCWNLEKVGCSIGKRMAQQQDR